MPRKIIGPEYADLNNDALAQIDAVRYANSFARFVEAYWNTIDAAKFQKCYHVDAICEHLQAVKDGIIKRLLIVCPPRHSKSALCQQMFPAWCWLTDPTLRFLCASHTESLAARDALLSRQLIKSNPYQYLFGSLFQLAEDQNQKLNFKNDHGGDRRSVGNSTSVMGVNADYLLVDDLIDYRLAKSDTERKGALDFYKYVLSSRLVMGTGKDRIVIAGHRTHQDDLFHMIHSTYGNSGEWTYLVLPAEARPMVTNSFYNKLGWKDTRKENQVLAPKICSKATLTNKKREYGHEYYCLYQADPTPANGEIFDRKWFRYWELGPENTYNLAGQFFKKGDNPRFQTIDTAVSTKEWADYTVIQTWEIVGNNLLLLHSFRGKIDGVRLPDTIIENWKANDRPEAIYIEQAFVGSFVVDQLRFAELPVRPWKAKGYNNMIGNNNKGSAYESAKALRAVSAEIRMSNNKVWFKTNADWLGELEKEILTFPRCVNDDQVDCLSMACLIADKYLGPCEPELSAVEKEEKHKEEKQSRFIEMMNYDPLRPDWN